MAWHARPGWFSDLSPERTSVHPVGGCIFIRLPSIFPVKEPFLLRPFERNLESGRTGPLDAIDIRIAGEHAKAGSVTHGYRVFLIPVLVAGQLSEIGYSESDAKDPLASFDRNMLVRVAKEPDAGRLFGFIR